MPASIEGRGHEHQRRVDVTVLKAEPAGSAEEPAAATETNLVTTDSVVRAPGPSVRHSWSGRQARSDSACPAPAAAARCRSAPADLRAPDLAQWPAAAC